MTTWSWTCRVCGVEFTNPAFRFIAKCPECEAEYVKLASANGIPSIGMLPIYALKNEPITNEKTHNSLLFAINVHVKEIECFTKEFYDYVQREFGEKILEKNVTLTFVEKEEE